MSDELKAEIDRLTKANAELTKKADGLAASVVDLNEVLKETRAEARDRRHEAKTLSQQLADLAADRDGWKTKVEAEPSALQARIDELAGTIRERDHKDAFARVATKLNVTDTAKQADLWTLSGYKSEGDQPDESRISEAIGQALKARPWYLDAPAPGGASPAAGAANGAATNPAGRAPAPGSERGQPLHGTAAASAEGRIPGRL